MMVDPQLYLMIDIETKSKYVHPVGPKGPGLRVQDQVAVDDCGSLWPWPRPTKFSKQHSNAMTNRK